MKPTISASAHPNRPLGLVALLAIIVVFAIALFGCATDTGNPTKDRFGRLTNVALEQVGKAAFQITASALADQVKTGFTSDWGYSLQQGLYTELPNIVSPATFREFADAWNPVAPAVNKQLTQLVKTAAPSTPAETQAVASTIAGAVATATNEHAAAIYAK